MHLPQSITRAGAPRWVQIVGGLVIAALLVLIVLVLARWPYRRTSVLNSLQETFSSKIYIAKYRLVFFPGPGFVAEGLVVRRNGEPNAPPLGTITRFEALGSYATLLFAPNRFQTLRLIGLHVQIPPAGTGEGNSTPRPKQKSTMVVEHLIADGSQLDINTEAGRKPLHFEIRRLHLDDVTTTRPMSFSVALIEPLLGSEIHADGKLGPIDTTDPGKTRVSANYALKGLDLGALQGVSGVAVSSGKFFGPLADISIHGDIEIPDFRLKRGNTIHLAASYRATVNAISGDITLNSVTSHLDKTTIATEGDVSGKPKLASLDFAVEDGRIQDLLRPFVSETPPMSGVVSLRARAVLPSSDEAFLKRLRMEGDFGIGGGHFSSSEKQHAVDAFSERSLEEKPPKEDPNPPPVISDVKGHAVVANGVATFTRLSFSIPGATALLNGTYNLTTERINLSGDLQMQTDVSHTMTGIKSLLLKPFIPFFKKKKHETRVPIQITGNYHHPLIGPSLLPK